MIITRTPFRVSFAGGGTDMATFYLENGGCVVSTTINKYMYLTIHPYFDEKKTALRFSEIEIVDDIKDIKHSIFRQVLNDRNIAGVEISSTADVPSGTGLGSSSSFTVGLLNALNCYQGRYESKADIAKEACEVEIEKLGNPIGKQDQYAAAFGGLNFIEFHPDESVSVSPIILKTEIKKQLQDNLVMFYTGLRHDANAILAEQKKNISAESKIVNLRYMSELAKNMRDELQTNNLSNIGALLNEGWIRKKELASSISIPQIDDLYACALRNGASGGKLLGAGGGGFLLFYCEKEKQQALEKALGLKHFPFQFENDGTSVIYFGDKY